MMNQLNTYAKSGPAHALANGLTLPGNPVLQSIISQIPMSDGSEAADPEIYRQLSFIASVPESVKGRLADDLQAVYSNDPQSYIVLAEKSQITVYAESPAGLLYGAYTLLQQAEAHEGLIPEGLIYNTPVCPYRGVKIYLPAAEDIAFFRQLIDMMVYYRYNSVIIEVGGAMAYKKHPEINESWVAYCREMDRYPARAAEVQGMFRWDKNSIHFENGGGRWLSQETVRELVAYCRERGLQVIPEVPTLSHSDYLLNAHPEFAERSCDPFPDAYCPSRPGVYPLVFDVLDEVIDVFQPDTIHIGHDEYYSYGVCELCRDRDPADIYAGDLIKIHDYLAEKGIRTMFWPEKLLDVADKTGRHFGGAEIYHFCDNGAREIIRKATWPAIDKIPRDVWAHHWYWELREELELEFLKRGIETTYGNFSPQKFPHWQQRIRAGVRGGATSSWTHLKELNLQRDAILMDIVFGAYLYWHQDYADEQYTELLPVFFEELFTYKYRRLLKQLHFSITHNTTILREWVYITSMPMTLQPIGRYEIRYKSGRTLEIPIVYGVNITNLNRFWDRHLDKAFDIYLVDNLLIEVSSTTLPRRMPDGTTQFTFLAENPYPDDPVQEVRLVQTVSESEGRINLIDFQSKER
ncbi:MAG: family 20 glycosylhydrolase [Clostridiaceae bacterium]|nr:family 20 glycosylhydrolase [Clostridiaceae bacterium]